MNEEVLVMYENYHGNYSVMITVNKFINTILISY